MAEKGKLPASFGTVSGLPDDYDIWFTSAEFGYRTNYGNGEAELLILMGESPDVDLADDHEERLSIGKNWEIKENGKRVSRGSKTDAKFTSNSRYGSWLQELGKLAETNPVIVEWMNDVDKRTLTPRDAAIWVGVGLHIKLVKYVTQEGKEKDVSMPSAFLGYKGPKGKAAAKTTTAAAAATKPAAESKAQVAPAAEAGHADSGSSDSAEFPGNSDVVKRTKLIALKAKDSDSFQLDAMDTKTNPGIGDPENQDLIAVILEDGPTGFWARVKGA